MEVSVHDDIERIYHSNQRNKCQMTLNKWKRQSGTTEENQLLQEIYVLLRIPHKRREIVGIWQLQLGFIVRLKGSKEIGERKVGKLFTKKTIKFISSNVFK